MNKYSFHFILIFFLINALLGCQEVHKSNKQALKTINSNNNIENCSFNIEYQNVPEKIITIGQHNTEILIKLGLKDKIIGWCFPDNEPLPNLPLIADQYPSKEIFLEKLPDFVFSGYLGSFDNNRLGSREYLKGININSYVSTARCITHNRPTNIDDIFIDISNLGKIFNVEEKAIELIASMKEKLANITNSKSKQERVKVWIFGGAYSDGISLTTGSYGLANQLVELAGGSNVFQDVAKQGFETNIEELIIRNPSVIVVKESIKDPKAKRSINFLTSNKALSSIDAIKNQRFVVVPFTALMPGIGVTDAVEIMYQGFYPTKQIYQKNE